MRCTRSKAQASCFITGSQHRRRVAPIFTQWSERNASTRENHPTRERRDVVGRDTAASRLSPVGWFSRASLVYYPTGGHFVCACVNMGCWRATEIATEAFSVNCLRSVPAAAGRFLELNDVYWVLRSTNMFFKVARLDFFGGGDTSQVWALITSPWVKIWKKGFHNCII